MVENKLDTPGKGQPRASPGSPSIYVAASGYNMFWVLLPTVARPYWALLIFGQVQSSLGLWGYQPVYSKVRSHKK